MKIFASYSRKNVDIVVQFEDVVQTLGDRYLRDFRDLRSGEDWSDRIMELIQEADTFQLFWSSNFMYSQFVRSEWEYALALIRENFIRPVYWEHPLPKDENERLPPPELARLHFQRLGAEQRRSTGGLSNGLGFRLNPSRLTSGTRRTSCESLSQPRLTSGPWRTCRESSKKISTNRHDLGSS